MRSSVVPGRVPGPRKTVRILGEILLLALGLAAILVVGRGLGPVAPALRVLLHPAVLVAVALLFVLLRLGGNRRTKSDRRPPHEADPNRDGL